MPTSYWLKFGNSACGFNGSGAQFTHVEQPGSLTVSLVGTGTGFDTTKQFSIVVTFGSAISYSVDGVPVQSPSATCTLTLHAGQSSVVGNIPQGTTYNVTESTLPSSDIAIGYSTGSVVGGSGTMTDGGSVAVTANYTFTDIASTLTVSVDLVVGVTASTSFPYYDAQKLCNFVVTFSEAITYTVDGVAISTPSSTYNGSLAKGGSVVLGRLPVGISYSVTENNFAQADRYRGYSTGTVTGGSGTTTAGGAFAATAKYSFEPYKVDVGMQGTTYHASFYENDGTTPASLYHLAPSGSGYDQDTGAAFSAGSKLRVFANGDGLAKKITITRESGTGTIYLWNNGHVQASSSTLTLTMDAWGALYYGTTPLLYDVYIKTTGE